MSAPWHNISCHFSSQSKAKTLRQSAGAIRRAMHHCGGGGHATLVGSLLKARPAGIPGFIRLVTSLNARATAGRACKGSPGPGGRESSDPAPGEGSDSIPGGRTWVAGRARGEGEGRAHREEVRPCPEERARLEQPHDVSLNESQNMNSCPLALYLLTLGQVLDVSGAPDTRRPLTRHRPHSCRPHGPAR